MLPSTQNADDAVTVGADVAGHSLAAKSGPPLVGIQVVPLATCGVEGAPPGPHLDTSQAAGSRAAAARKGEDCETSADSVCIQSDDPQPTPATLMDQTPDSRKTRARKCPVTGGLATSSVPGYPPTLSPDPPMDLAVRARLS